MVNEQQETLGTPGISSNIQNGTIADDVRTGSGIRYIALSCRQRHGRRYRPINRRGAGDNSRRPRLTDALPQWWHLNNNRGEINSADQTALLKSWWSGNFRAPLPEADYRNANSK